MGQDWPAKGHTFPGKGLQQQSVLHNHPARGTPPKGTAADHATLPGPAQTPQKGGRSLKGPSPQKEEADSSFQLRSLDSHPGHLSLPSHMLTRTSSQRGWAEGKPSPVPKHSSSTSPGG